MNTWKAEALRLRREALGTSPAARFTPAINNGIPGSGNEEKRTARGRFLNKH